MSHRSVLPSIAWSFAFLHSIRENLMVTRRRDSPSAVWRPINSEYSPSPALLNALTLALYRELKCNPSTVQIVSRPQYTSWSNTPRLIRLDTSFSDASNFPLRRMIRIHIYIWIRCIYIYKCTIDRKHRSSFQKIEIYPEFTATSVVQFQQVSLDGGPPLTGTPNDSVARWWLPGDCHAVVLRAALFRYQYRRSRGWGKEMSR